MSFLIESSTSYNGNRYWGVSCRQHKNTSVIVSDAREFFYQGPDCECVNVHAAKKALEERVKTISLMEQFRNNEGKSKLERLNKLNQLRRAEA